MSEDEGEAGAEEEQRKPDASRPVTAAARRERRRAARAGDNSSAKRKSPPNKDDTKDSGARGGKEGKHSAGATTEKKGRSTRSRDSAEASKKPSVFARIRRFLREVIAELRKVIWPTRKQMITYTSVVLVFVVVMTAFIFGLDYGSTKLMSVVFG